MSEKYSMTWDLDVIFPGGSDSSEFRTYVEKLEQDVNDFDKRIQQMGQRESEDLKFWRQVLKDVQDLNARLGEAISFVHCLLSQNVHDEKAKIHRGRLSQIHATFNRTVTRLDRLFLEMNDSTWKSLLQDPDIQPIAFPLKEQRQRASEKLPSEMESLAGDLAVDGYHAWEELYNTIVGRMTIPFEEDGEVKDLSVGQAANKLSSSDREIRRKVFHRMNEAWSREEELLASSLNHLSGFRLNLYHQRGWDSVLKEPLDLNRMSEETLQTMWKVITEHKGEILRFFQRKASLLGLHKLSWYDLYAPISQGETHIPYDEAADFIMEQFRSFHPEMADFANKAFVNRWIEAEDRPGKRPGGFCTSFDQSNQTRIFMTYSGSASNVNTLAHELGHAYHQHVMNDLPQMVQQYAMNVAETASTFAESIVARCVHSLSFHKRTPDCTSGG